MVSKQNAASTICYIKEARTKFRLHNPPPCNSRNKQDPICIVASYRQGQEVVLPSPEFCALVLEGCVDLITDNARILDARVEQAVSDLLDRERAEAMQSSSGLPKA